MAKHEKKVSAAHVKKEAMKHEGKKHEGKKHEGKSAIKK